MGNHVRMRDVQKAIDAAEAALENSYSPYSNIKVAAALVASCGKIYTGVNVESSSYGLTICAERSAVAKAVTGGEREFVHIVVVSSLETLPFPCGACLQVLSEFADDMDITLLSANERTKTSLRRLLPMPFSILAKDEKIENIGQEEDDEDDKNIEDGKETEDDNEIEPEESDSEDDQKIEREEDERKDEDNEGI